MLGTSGRTRTGTLLRAGDFESPMSTNSITLAKGLSLAFSPNHCWAGTNRPAIIAVTLWGSTDLHLSQVSGADPSGVGSYLGSLTRRFIQRCKTWLDKGRDYTGVAFKRVVPIPGIAGILK